MAIVSITGKDLDNMKHTYKRGADWRIGKQYASDVLNTEYTSSGGIMYNIQSLNKWVEQICNPLSKYYSNSAQLLDDIYDAMLSINSNLPTNILQLTVEFCCNSFYQYITMNSFIHTIAVNDDHHRNKEFAFNILNNGEELWNKWYCPPSYKRYSKCLPNSNVLIIAFYFDMKVIINRYMIKTANDCETRDPLKWILFGDNFNNINKNKGTIIQNVIHHHDFVDCTFKLRALTLTTKRWAKNWFNIDTKKVYYNNNNECNGGYDTYILAIYGNCGAGHGRETQIGQIEFECIDESKIFLYNQFDSKLDEIINAFNKKGLSIAEMQRCTEHKFAALGQ